MTCEERYTPSEGTERRPKAEAQFRGKPQGGLRAHSQSGRNVAAGVVRLTNCASNWRCSRSRHWRRPFPRTSRGPIGRHRHRSRRLSSVSRLPGESLLDPGSLENTSAKLRKERNPPGVQQGPTRWEVARGSGAGTASGEGGFT